MSNRGLGDGLNFEATVQGAQGRKELDALLKKIRQLGTEAVLTGDKIDQSTADAAKSYNRLAQEIAETIQTEQQLQRSVEATRASRERANAAAANAATAKIRTGTAVVTDELVREKLVGQQIANNVAQRRAESAQLEAQSRIALTNDKREQLAEERAVRNQERASRAAQERKRQEDTAWSARTRQLDTEEKAQSRIAAQIDSEFSKREQLRQREQRAVMAQAEREIEQIRRVEAAAAASAIKRADERRNPSIANLNATRYALYDIATTAAIVGAAVAGIGVYASVTATKFEYAFSSVRRAAQLTGDDVARVRQEFIDLSTAVPATFEEISGAGTLGAQMGILGDDLDKFASTVTRFSATTNASIDTTSQTFGRLSSLLDVPASKFENLGSAIAKVGVESVATETEILQTTQQIAGASAVYGFTADQVVALGAAFSSLAIAPEAARGSVTRIFGDIEKAVGTGGEALASYAEILNMSVEDTAELWETDPSEFFRRLISGLSTSRDLLRDITAIGANDVRDINLLQRLAGSPEVLENALRISNQAFVEGTYLQEAYAIQTDNLQSKLEILINTFNALANQAGGPLNEALKIGVDILTFFLRLVGQIPAPVLALVAGLAALVGGYILLKGGQAAAIAGLLAMQTALKGLQSNAALAGVSMQTLNAVARQTWAMFSQGATTVEAASTKLRGFQAAAVGLGKGLGVMAAITAALWLLGEAATQVDYIFADSAGKAEAYFTDISGFAEAVRADTAAYLETGDAISTFTTKVDEIPPTIQSAQDATEMWIGVQGEAESAATTTTGAIEEQTIALGENAEEWLRQALSQQEGIQKLANNEELKSAFYSFGGDINDFITAGLEGDSTSYVDAILANAEAALESAYARSGGAESDETVKLQQQIALLESYLVPAATATDNLVQSQIEGAKTAQFLGQEIGTAADQIDTSGDVAAEATTKYDELKAALDNLFSGVTTEGDFIESIDELFTKLDASGGQFDTFSEEGRAALDALQSAMLSTIEYGDQIGLSAQDSLVPLFLQLQQQGVDTTMLLQQLASSPLVYSADLDITALLQKLAAARAASGGLIGAQGVLGGVLSSTANYANQNAAATKRVGGAAGGAAKQVKTLSDYAADLGKVFKSAFDIRFGAGKALDDISSGWSDIADNTAEAQRKLNDYQADLLDLQSKKAILEYQLGVAIDYNDTLRAGEIQAELAKINGDLAKTQADVDDATSEASKTLVGNSDAAIRNRSEILDLVESYAEYIEQLANSGLNQAQLQEKVAQLRNDFLSQATALGYNVNELGFATEAFNDMSLAIAKVPRKITIAADPNPAQRAIDEFLAANSGGRGASGGVSVPITTTFDESALKKFARAQEIQARITQLQKLLAQGGFGFGYGINEEIKKLVAQLNSGNYASGGFVPWDAPSDKRKDNGFGMLPSGRTVGLQGGEPIINNAARSKYGDAMFEQINALQYKPYAAPTIVVQSDDRGYAEYMSLGQTERGYLIEIIQAIRAGLVISGTAIRETVSTGNVNDTRRRVG